MKRTSAAATSPLSSGFTLLEVLLASGLMVLLMAGIGAALNQYYRLTTLGHVDIERSRLLRALRWQLTEDLRNVTFPLQPEATDDTAAAASSTASTASSALTAATGSSGSSGSTGGSSSSGSTSSSTSTTSSTSDETTVVQKSLGIVGDATYLTIDVSLARPNLYAMPTMEGETLAIRTSDLKQVTYFYSASGIATPGTTPPPGGVAPLGATIPGGTATGTPSSMASAGIYSNGVTAGAGGGLARSEIDRMQVVSTGVTSETASTNPNLQPVIIAPEVTSATFRYWDGTSWYTSWDSTSLAKLPRAIEVTLALTPAESGLGSLYHNNTKTRSNQQVFVIAIPLADPAPAEATQ